LKSKSRLAITFWLPLASLVAVEIYVRNFDGWGAWATAPLFLVPFLLSLVIGGAGISRCIREFREGCLEVSTAVFTGVAALPVAWLLVRRYFV
jgi:hypothetical protein